MERFKVGIIGAGHIARKMAHTLRDMEGVEPYAVASRNQEMPKGLPVNGVLRGLTDHTRIWQMIPKCS